MQSYFITKDVRCKIGDSIHFLQLYVLCFIDYVVEYRERVFELKSILDSIELSCFDVTMDSNSKYISFYLKKQDETLFYQFLRTNCHYAHLFYYKLSLVCRIHD